MSFDDTTPAECYASLWHMLISLIVCLASQAAALHPPAAYTGAPREGSCRECHSRTGTSHLQLEFQPLMTYTPGVAQIVRLRIATPHTRTGFQVTARDELNRQAGVFTAGDESELQVSNGFQYVNHRRASSQREYRFRWTPPFFDMGTIRFYASAVAGDETMLATQDLRAATSTGPPAGYRWEFLDGVGTPAAISNFGVIAGNGTPSSNGGYVRNPNGSVIAVTVPAAASTSITDINSSWTVVGSYRDTVDVQHGFVRDANGLYTTVDYPSGSGTVLLAITDQGQTLGRTQLGGATRYFLRNSAGGFQLLETSEFPGALVDLLNDGTLLGVQDESRAIGVGRAVYTRKPGSSSTAVFSCGGTRGGNVSVAMSDNFDMTVDCTEFGPGFFPTNRKLVRFASGATLPLSSLFSTLSYGVSALSGINAGGQIVGIGQISSASNARPLLLTPCIASLSGSPARIPYTGGTTTVHVNAQTGCRANVTTSGGFPFTVSEPGLGDGLLSIAAAPNSLPAPQQLTLTVGPTSLTVVQDAAPSACTYTVLSVNTRFAGAGGSGSLSISTRDDCAWTLTTPPWVSVGQQSGQGFRALDFQVTQNGGPTRTGTIAVGTQGFSIEQIGIGECIALPARDSYTAFSPSGVSTFMDVITNPGCTWTASSSVPWLLLQLGFNATPASTITTTGSQTLYVNLSRNEQAYPRSTAVSLNTRSVTLTQSGTVEGYSFVPVAPCRVADTRLEGNKSGPFGPPRVQGQTTRSISLAAAGCGVPSNARAVSVNITVVPQGYLGFLTAYADGGARPLASTLNSWNGRTVANAAILPVGPGAAIALYASNDTDVIIDVNGYFTNDGVATRLQFYPVTPCRAVDTRTTSGKTGEFGPPAIVPNVERSFRLTQSGCNIPSGAKAFSLNITAVTNSYLAYLTAWPAGQDRPFVSTLNSWDGQVVPNAAIVPSGADGAVSIFSPNATDVLIDVNGYFAPPSTGGLNFYPLAPCRVADTRAGEGKSGPFGPPTPLAQASRSIPVPQSACGSAPESKAYVFNITAVPQGYLGFVSLWSAGLPQPLVSTVNSWNGQVVANAAIVPAGTNGALSFYVSNTTDIVMDLNGFFLP